MPLFYQKMIYRSHLRANPGVLFIFGDNNLRKGMRGQAAQMRGEPNAVGVRTKWAPTMSTEAFFNDMQINETDQMFTDDLTPVWEALKNHRIVIWPADGIGTGLSDLSNRAPLTWKLLEGYRTALERV